MDIKRCNFLLFLFFFFAFLIFFSLTVSTSTVHLFFLSDSVENIIVSVVNLCL